MYLLVNNLHLKNVSFFVKITRFVPCTLLCLYIKNISKLLTKWKPSQTYGNLQQDSVNTE